MLRRLRALGTRPTESLAPLPRRPQCCQRGAALPASIRHLASPSETELDDGRERLAGISGIEGRTSERARQYELKQGLTEHGETRRSDADKSDTRTTWTHSRGLGRQVTCIADIADQGDSRFSLLLTPSNPYQGQRQGTCALLDCTMSAG